MRPLIIIGRHVNWAGIPKVSGFERWTVSSAYFDNPAEAACADLIFQIHAPKIWEPEISKIKCRLVIAWDVLGYEHCEHLPVKNLLAEFGPVFPSSINWMLAYALYLGYDKIIIEGVDMTHESEYGDQRDSLFYMLGIARARGVKVLVNPASGIYMPPAIYGVEVKG
jgi:hypothetical protein